MGLRFVFLQKDPIPNLATMCLSAVLEQHGHACEVLIDPAEPDLLRRCRRLDPDVVCFSATTGPHAWQLETARRIKERWSPVILMGGPHPTFYPRVLEENEALDYICMGEGEDCIVALAGVLERGGDVADVANLGWRDADGTPIYNPLGHLEQEFDRWPFPDRSVYDRYEFVRKRRTVSVMATRGCPFRCTFCFNVTLQEMYRGAGRYVRSKPPERMIAELEDVLARYPHVRQIGFADDIFVVDYKRWGREFLALYAERIGLPFTCLLRPDLVTPELAASLAAANCRVVKIGLETGVEELRIGVLKKGKLDNAGMRRAGRLLKDAGIQLYTFNIFGIPGETLEMGWETVRLNVEMGTDFAWTALCQPYPGTHLEDWARRHGYLEADGCEDDFGYTYFVDTPLELEHKRELCNLQKLMPLVVTWPRLEPLVRRLVRLPPNQGFDLAFRAHYALGLVRTGQLDLRDVARLLPLTGNYWKRRARTGPAPEPGGR